jgi:hypothetical protein
MAYPLRRYDPAPDDEPQFVRPTGPVIVEDEPTRATAPAGARVPPRRLPPGVSGTDFEPPFRRDPPLVPVSGLPPLTGHYLSFLPVAVVTVFVVLFLVTLLGAWAVGAL